MNNFGNLFLNQIGYAPFGLFIDAAGSKDWLEEIPDSIDNSAIRPRDDWQKNIDEGLEYWKSKDGVGLPKL